MKFKKLILITIFLLAILSVSAVSASDDLSTDSLTSDDESDSITLKSDETNTLSSEEPDIDISDNVNINNNDYIVELYDYDDSLNGSVSLSIDDVKYYDKTVSDRYSLYIQVYDLNLPSNFQIGKHTVKVSYLKNGASTPFTSNKTVMFDYEPEIEYSDEISVGETSIINIEYLPGSSGTATLYYYNSTNDNITGTASSGVITNGVGKVVIPGLSKGYHSLFLNMTINNRQYTRTINLDVMENSVGYTASVPSRITLGENAVVTFSGSKNKGWLSIYVDGVWIKDLKYFGGSLSENIAGLSEGKHDISVSYFKNQDNYFKTFTVEVVKKAAPKISISLKTVSVKKSAKKVVISATFKSDNSAVKGKKVTFKFNGKKYTAKTNNKGVAKVTIKSNVLKKLKKGKKVSYSAEYSSKTVKKTVKVKK